MEAGLGMKARTDRQGTLAMLSLYACTILSFSGVPSFQKREDGMMNLEDARHMGHFLVFPESRTPPGLLVGSRHCLMH